MVFGGVVDVSGDIVCGRFFDVVLDFLIDFLLDPLIDPLIP